MDSGEKVEIACVDISPRGLAVERTREGDSG